jgi:hypothetical protein
MKSRVEIRGDAQLKACLLEAADRLRDVGKQAPMQGAGKITPKLVKQRLPIR